VIITLLIFGAAAMLIIAFDRETRRKLISDLTTGGRCCVCGEPAMEGQFLCLEHFEDNQI
jgi:hypothetical protein